MSQVPLSTQEEIENIRGASVHGRPGRHGGGVGKLPRDAGLQLKQEVASPFRPKALGVHGGKEMW